MSVLDMSNIYDATFYGEPLSLPVRRATLNTDRLFWTVGDWMLVLPKTIVRRAPDVQQMLGDIEAWTGWSKRPRHQPHHRPQRRGGPPPSRRA
jgi:hypothetical protein